MFEKAALSRAIKAHGRVARVVIAETRGSTPREEGAAMLVWKGGQEGTIGGGAAELAAVEHALQLLAGDRPAKVTRMALGPDIGQCCGGALTLVSEVFDAACLRGIDAATASSDVHLRRVGEGPEDPPAALLRQIARHKAEGRAPMAITLMKGWLAESVWRDSRPVYIYGAGHVGDALARVLAPLVQFSTHLVDLRPPLFAPQEARVTLHLDRPPTEVMAAAEPCAYHLIMTPDHDYDLTLCHQLLSQPFAFGGLIGSDTKWARFRKRLASLGHNPAAIGRITCPIGDPALGKAPQAIAIGVAQDLIRRNQTTSHLKEAAA